MRFLFILLLIPSVSLADAITLGIDAPPDEVLKKTAQILVAHGARIIHSDKDLGVITTAATPTDLTKFESDCGGLQPAADVSYAVSVVGKETSIVILNVDLQNMLQKSITDDTLSTCNSSGALKQALGDEISNAFPNRESD